MQYEPEFARNFMHRTLVIAQTYEGQFDATLLLNCLLGLLVVPKEALLDKIPKDSLDQFLTWGISPSSIKCYGKCDQGYEHPPNLRQLVRRMRNAVAHFRVEPKHNDGLVTAFSFKDNNGFHAELSLTEISDFVQRLAKHLEIQA